MTRQQLADLRDCDPATVSRAHLPKVDGRNYDLKDPEVRGFVVEHWVEDALRRERAKTPDDPANMKRDALEEEKLRAEIEWKREQTEKIRVAKEQEKRNLLPAEAVGIILGYFVTGIKTNIFTLGGRIARGDKALQEKIEKEITKALEKTLAGAEAGLRREAKPIIKALKS